MLQLRWVMLNELRCVLLKQFELLHDVVVVDSVRPKLARCIARFLELVAQRACCAATCHAPQTCWLRLCKYWAMPRAHLARTEMIDEQHLLLLRLFAEARAWQSFAGGDESWPRTKWPRRLHFRQHQRRQHPRQLRRPRAADRCQAASVDNFVCERMLI